MGTQFEDFAGSGKDDFFGNGEFGGFHDNDDNGEDQEKMIKDGNAQVLRHFEARKKSGDYARSQISRTKKQPDLNMNQVDWSGFPGAAHKASPAERNQKRATRRASLQHDGVGDLEEHKNLLHRAQRRLSASNHGPSLMHSEHHVEPPPPSASPRMSPNARKYRNRRHLSKTAGIPGTPDWGEGQHHKSADEAERPKRSMTGLKARAERRNSGSHGHRRPSSSGVAGRAASRSKSLTRRVHAAPQRRSLSPPNGSGSRAHSSSPMGRIRRPVAAAASSTTLDTGKNTTRRKTKQRSSSRGRKGTQKSSVDAGEEVFQKASSFRW